MLNNELEQAVVDDFVHLAPTQNAYDGIQILEALDVHCQHTFGLDLDKQERIHDPHHANHIVCKVSYMISAHERVLEIQI